MSSQAEYKPVWQNLAISKNPEGFRGRPAWFVQLWWIVQSTLFGCSPQVFYGWRRFLLRLSGAKIGKHVIIRPTVRVTHPWRLSVGDYAWIGDNVKILTVGEVYIGPHAVVSQESYLCSGSHDHTSIGFDVYAKPVRIEAEAWLATDVFVAPGITIGTGAIVGSRSSVYSDIPAGMIAAGTPARIVKARTTRNPGAV